jgi:menaquinone-dependent protoporphyrinogen oxidase
MMRRIASREGGDTDTSRDHEYTDWERLRQQVEAFLEPLRSVDMEAELEAVPAGR